MGIGGEGIGTIDDAPLDFFSPDQPTHHHRVTSRGTTMMNENLRNHESMLADEDDDPTHPRDNVVNANGAESETGDSATSSDSDGDDDDDDDSEDEEEVEDRVEEDEEDDHVEDEEEDPEEEEDEEDEEDGSAYVDTDDLDDVIGRLGGNVDRDGGTSRGDPFGL